MAEIPFDLAHKFMATSTAMASEYTCMSKVLPTSCWRVPAAS